MRSHECSVHFLFYIIIGWGSNSRSYEGRASDETANLYRIGDLCNIDSPGDDAIPGTGLKQR